MIVNISNSNPALASIINEPNQVITLDANFLIPPDRPSKTGALSGYTFESFRRIWIEPIFLSFPSLAIHEAVYDEIISPFERVFIDQNIVGSSPRLSIHRDSSLSLVEQGLRNSIEDRIYPLTKYDPQLDNKHDRGEVKSLSYIAVKGLLYFAAHDSNAIRLIEDAQILQTGLDNVHAIKMYEMIFYLYISGNGNIADLRNLYRYQYYLTAREKTQNPGWGEYIEAMKALYGNI